MTTQKLCPKCGSLMTHVYAYIKTPHGPKLKPYAWICPKCSYQEPIYPRPRAA